MFTGIIEATGKVISIEKDKSNLRFGIECAFAKELKIGQSVAHNGVCLTVENISSSRKNYTVTAVKETLDKSNLGLLKKGNRINLERSLKIGDRLDGHFVQGHVDCMAEVNAIKKEKGSWSFKFQVSNSKSQVSNLIIEKGSICINGVSLTVVDTSPNGGDLEGASFSVAIIPHTFKHTNFSSLKKGDKANIEFDILGKHIEKILSSRLS
ncbi:MAG: riboflavin synthase [Bacteroidetes bacterium]|nr:riboflavin synthase [Bacteroidota bacterium]